MPKENKLPTKKRKEKILMAVRNKVWNTYIGPNERHGKCFCCDNTQISIENFDCGHIQSRTQYDQLIDFCKRYNEKPT